MRNYIVRVSIAVLIVVNGCAAAPERELSTELADYMGLPNGHDPLNPAEFRHDSGHADLSHFERVHGRPLKILQLSGGGQNGAFGAGVLVGWAESGTRPEFDIVTGVSTGALMATFAFLGTPRTIKPCRRPTRRSQRPMSTGDVAG